MCAGRTSVNRIRQLRAPADIIIDRSTATAPSEETQDMQHIEAASGGGGGNYISLLILVVLAGGLFYMSSRSRKTQRKQQDFRKNLAVGQEVMTASGMLGRVVAVDDDAITIESTPGASTRWVRAAISKVLEPATPDATESNPVSTTTENGLLGSSSDSIEIPDDLSGLPDDGNGSSQGPSTTK
jgi:preprotein translocase subunit YajC